MDTDERIAPFVEELPGYAPLPQIPLPALADLTWFLSNNVYLSPAGKTVLRAGLKLAGFNGFFRTLPGQQENLLRRANLRGAVAYAPQVSASLALADDPAVHDPLERAARLVLAAHELCLDIQSGALPQDLQDGQPLEMGQYPNLFSTCLVLGEGRDRVFKSTRQERIAVLVQGHLFLLVTGAPGCGVSVAQIRQGLADIVERAHRLGDGRQGSPGYLSGCSNPTQRTILRRIRNFEGNQHTLHSLRHTFLTLCLDLQAEPADAAALTLQAQVGDPANRWYHASLQLVVCANARAAAIMNFSTGLDGNVMMRGAGELARRARQAFSAAPGTALTVERLSWTMRLPGQIMTRQELEMVIDPDQRYTFEFPGLGRTFWRARGLPAVPAFVCALQLATQRLERQVQTDPATAARLAEKVRRFFPRRPPPPPGPRPLAILQFVSLSQYAAMGLTQADVSTPAVAALAQGLLDGTLEPPAARALLNQAVTEQQAVVQAARHLLPLSSLLPLFRLTRRGLGRLWSEMILLITLRLMRLLGMSRTYPRSILISFPVIDPDVPVVGRPGVHLGYLRYFGLHYQVFDDRIVLTWMPGITWPFSNEQTTQALRQALAEVAALGLV